MVRPSRYIVLAALFVFASPATTAAENPAIDPAAMAALQKMGTYLRTLTAFRVKLLQRTRMSSMMERRSKNSGVTDMLARMPGKLRAEVTDDRHQRLFPPGRQDLHTICRTPGLLRKRASTAHDSAACRKP